MQNHKNSTKILFMTKEAIAKAQTYSKEEYVFSLGEQLDAYKSDGWKIVIVADDKKVQDPSDEFIEYVSELRGFMEKLSCNFGYIHQCVFCVEPGDTTGTIAYAISETEQWPPRHFELPRGATGMRMPHSGMVLYVLQYCRANPEHCLFVGLDGRELRTGENAKVPSELVENWIRKEPPGLS